MQPSESTAKANRSVLVVDDDEALRRMVCRALGEHHTVYEAADAASALRLLLTIPPPDVMVLDVMMPGVNGFDLAREVRANPALKHVPIVFLTARSSAMDVVEGINAGARSYVTKPFKIAALVERVRKLADAGRPAP
jgi:putative two-component system response regulator